MALPSTPFYEENAQGEGFKAATLSDDVFFQLALAQDTQFTVVEFEVSLHKT